jgi:hypothetical protein
LAALIAPDERRTDHYAPIIEDDEPVHLAAETDGPNLFSLDTVLPKYASNRVLSRIPPVLRTLFGPQWTMHRHVFMGRCEVRTDTAVLVDQQGA